MKTALKIVVAAAFVACVIVGLIFTLLPGPRDVGKMAGVGEREGATPAPPAEPERTGGSRAGQAVAKANGQPERTEEKSKAKAPEVIDKKEFDRLQLNALVDIVRFDEMEKFDFCEGIRNQRSAIKSRSEAYQAMKDNRPRELAADPTWMALNGPMIGLLGSPSMKRVGEMMVEDESHSFFRKAEFYYNLVKALREVSQRRAQVERDSRGYYMMYVMARLQNLKPEIMADEKFVGVCRHLNEQLHSGSGPETGAKDLEELLAHAGVAGEEVGYSRAKGASTVKAEQNGEHFALGIETPWVDEILEGARL